MYYIKVSVIFWWKLIIHVMDYSEIYNTIFMIVMFQLYIIWSKFSAHHWSISEWISVLLEQFRNLELMQAIHGFLVILTKILCSMFFSAWVELRLISSVCCPLEWDGCFYPLAHCQIEGDVAKWNSLLAFITISLYQKFQCIMCTLWHLTLGCTCRLVFLFSNSCQGSSLIW